MVCSLEGTGGTGRAMKIGRSERETRLSPRPPQSATGVNTSNANRPPRLTTPGRAPE